MQKNTAIYYILFIVLLKLLFALFLPLNFDEIQMLNILSSNSWDNISHHLIMNDTQLPFYYYIIHKLHQIGVTDPTFLRIFNWLLGLSIIPICFQIEKENIQKNKYFFTTLCLSTYYSIIHTTIIRPYIFLFIFGLILVKYFLKKEDQNKLGDWFFLSLSLILCAQTHYFGLYLAILFILFYPLKTKVSATRISISVFLAIAFFLIFQSSFQTISYDIVNIPIHRHNPNFIEAVNRFIYIIGGTEFILYTLIICLFYFQKNLRIDFDFNRIKSMSLFIGLFFSIPLFVSYNLTPCLETRFFACIIPFNYYVLINFIPELRNKKLYIAFYLFLLFSISRSIYNLDSDFYFNFRKAEKFISNIYQNNSNSKLFLTLKVCPKDIYFKNYNSKCVHQYSKKDTDFFHKYTSSNRPAILITDSQNLKIPSNAKRIFKQKSIRIYTFNIKSD